MKVPKRIAQAVINSLKGGVVPRVGLGYITVGRKKEIEALLHDTDIVSDGGSSMRFIVGRYGSGKSFLLQAIRTNAMERGFVVMDADLSPERRLQGTKGQGLATYRELVGNLAIRTKAEGGALTMVLDRWISMVQTKVLTEHQVTMDDPALAGLMEREIAGTIGALEEMVHGFDFARILSLYWKAYLEGDDRLKASVVKWFRGEYATKSEAKAELGVNIIIGDDDWYEYLKLFACFFHQAGYSGLIVLIDELVNLYKIPNAITRQYNYEKILAMYNDAMQGKAHYLGVLMGGTVECMEDRRRGLYSYEALRSRLEGGQFSKEHVDYRSPVIKLLPLGMEEMVVLVGKLAEIHSGLYGYQNTLTDGDLETFVKTEYGRIGSDSHITPREVIRDFIELLDITSQQPGLKVADLLGSDRFTFAKSELDSQESDASFAEFTV